MKKLKDKEWETFFDLLTRITGGSGLWKEKKQEVVDKAKENGVTTQLEELASWFMTED